MRGLQGWRSAPVAAKPFVWPLIVWLLVTRRFRAGAWSIASTAALVLGAWAVVGFEGFVDYPALTPRAAGGLHAQRSLSLAMAAGGFGASVPVASRWPAGPASRSSLSLHGSPGAPVAIWSALRSPSWHAWRPRRSSGYTTSRCSSSRSRSGGRRLSAAWFFGFNVLLAERLPGLEYVVPEPCCRPADVPKFVWDVNHGIAEPWQALGVAALICAVIVSSAKT